MMECIFSRLFDLIAGVLARFVVIVQPPTSLRQTKADLVAFDAIALRRAAQA